MTTATTRHPARRATSAVARTLTVGLLVAVAAASTQPHATRDDDGLVLVAEPFDPEVILPGRVDAALHRTWDGVRRSVATVDDRQHRKARKALTSTRAGFVRSLAAVLHQVEAVPPPDAEESTAGPDSALAHLNVTGSSVHMLAGLYEGVRAPRLLEGITGALVAAQQRRATLITTLTALDPEEAGAPYADALIDTVPFYADEVSSLEEALQDDALTPAARTALESALVRSRAAEAAMLAAYGGSD